MTKYDTWKNEDLKTTAMLVDGISFKLFQTDLNQEDDSKKTTAYSGSEQGNYLFAALLNYANSIEKFTDIQNHVNFNFDIVEEIKSPIELLVKQNIEEPIDYITNNVLTISNGTSYPTIVGYAIGHLHYFRAIENNNFLIIAPPLTGRGDITIKDSEIIPLERRIILDHKDAFEVLSRIYDFSDDKGVLNKIYNQAKEFYNIKEWEDEQILCVF